MAFSKSRFIRVGSRIGAGVIVGAVLAVVPMSSSSATHLTNVTLSSALVAEGQPSVLLAGTVDNDTDSPPGCYYGWNLTSASGTLSGSSAAAPPGAHVIANYGLTVNTASLAPGVHNVSVTSNWVAPAGCDNDGPKVANATITVIASRNGSFKCSAYAARTQTDYQPANPAYSPCKDENNYYAQLSPIAGLGNLGVTRSITDQEPNNLNLVAPKTSDYANSEAHIAGVDLTVAGVRIRTGALWSQSAVNCTGVQLGKAVPKFNTNGTVATLNANGRSFGTTSGYVKITVLNVTIELNKVTSTSTSRVRQALVITRNSLFAPTKTIVGETRIGVAGNPCQA